MSSRTYKITLLITEAHTQTAVPGLTIEAWDKDLIFDDYVGTAVTGADGKAVFTFTEEHFTEKFFDRRPDLFFKIFRDGKLILSTEETVLWNVTHGDRLHAVELPAKRKKQEGTSQPMETLTPGEPSTVTEYTVSGIVMDIDGEPLSGQILYAVDVDLKGAARYQGAATTADISAANGFEFLGNTISDENGYYLITFDSTKYANAERKKADVVVYALDKSSNIIGRSHLVDAREYVDGKKVINLAVVVTWIDNRDEYKRLMEKVSPFMKDSDVDLADIANSAEQIKFTASELDESGAKIGIAADAAVIRKGIPDADTIVVFHEALYGIGRQQIQLTWPELYRKPSKDLGAAIQLSIDENIIQPYLKPDIDGFLAILHKAAATQVLHYGSSATGPTLYDFLRTVLTDTECTTFTGAVRSFTGTNYNDFWTTYLPAFGFTDLTIKRLLLLQQLMLVTGSYLPLIKELQARVASFDIVLKISQPDWVNIILLTTVGTPDFIKGGTPVEKAENYAEQILNVLHSTYPTAKVVDMVTSKQLPVADTIFEQVKKFFTLAPLFDFATSQVHDFDDQVKAASTPDTYEDVKNELKSIQRVMQVSTTPAAMTVLKTANLTSAYAITSIPKDNFVAAFAPSMDGKEGEAGAVYERASFISARAGEHAMKMMESSHALLPALVGSDDDRKAAIAKLQGKIPDYSQLFGSPDVCECEECRSVYSASAYFVDALKFLDAGKKNDDSKTPLGILQQRRPDLLALPLTCENTNTVIPYIDLVNEIMEYYAVNDIIDEKAVHDTGEATAAELRANPQYTQLEAYDNLRQAVYPFSLPYHQPLDVIRTYSSYLKTSRYEVMKAMQANDATDAVKKAADAESLALCEEEYIAITGYDFSNKEVKRPVNDYFGYTNPADMEKMAGTNVPDGIHEFLRRSGMQYTELIELLETTYINPAQHVVDYLEKLFANSKLNSKDIYDQLSGINSGADPNAFPEIVNALNAALIDKGDFVTWLKANFTGFTNVITLYQSDSMCDLNTTCLRTIKNVYSPAATTSGIDDTAWTRLHKFIRLWKKLGWSITDTDAILSALGYAEITTATIDGLVNFVQLSKQLKLPLNQLATLWGNIEIFGGKPLYAKLFLNKAVLSIDTAFSADKLGQYLAGTTTTLDKHIPAILAALRITQDDLQAILSVATVIDNGNPRAINLGTDVLNITNLSTIYRYVVLSRALSLKINDCCLFTSLFGINPVSTWDITNKKYINISPSTTLGFYNTVSAIKASGFKPAVLQYIFSGTLPAGISGGFDEAKAKQTAKDITSSFAAIQLSYPDVPSSQLTADILAGELSASFDADTVSQLMGILQSQKVFSVPAPVSVPVTITSPLSDVYSYNSTNGVLSCIGIITVDNANKLKTLSGTTDAFKAAVDALFVTVNDYFKTVPQLAVTVGASPAVTIPAELSPKYTFAETTGRLTGKGIMYDSEKAALKALATTGTPFDKAVEALYAIPGDFITVNFSSVIDITKDLPVLLNRTPAEAAGIDDKLALVYSRYAPQLRQQLYKNSIIQHIAAFTNMSEAVTAVLVNDDISPLAASLSSNGLSVEYFNDTQWAAVLPATGTDSQVNFSWGANGPATSVNSDKFGVKWSAFVTPPASDTYSIIVDVKTADDIFNLYIDGALVLAKSSADTKTSWQYDVVLNTSNLYNLVLAYADVTGDAGITLSWKTAGTAKAVIPASAFTPAAGLNTILAWGHRAAQFINGFKLDDKEAAHLAKYSADFNNINFKALSAVHWQRISSYVQLCNTVPQAQARLIDVFAAANNTSAASPIDSLVNLLVNATGWDKTVTASLAATFKLGATDFKNEIALNKLLQAVQLVSVTGVTPAILNAWAFAGTGFNDLNTVAQLVKGILKASYEEEEWLTIAGGLNDKIRENQKQALISYLLTKPALQTWGATDADGLFEYFLIDVQMGACMDTSRIVQANSAMQMFVNRCLLNLESNKDTAHKEHGVAPDAISAERWKWMKQYRVWEANRKVFLYPENWLEPEWRDDSSSFFKELESELVQNDITTSSVETAFRNYLGKLNDVASVDVCGMYQEKDETGKPATLHVVARNHNAPYHFYYRTWDTYMKWNAWEKIPVDIRSIEAGDLSGAHAMPIVWKNRLFIFWPEFLDKQRDLQPKNENGQDATIEDLSTQKTKSLKAANYMEVRLAWTERANNKWGAKQVTKEFIEIDAKKVQEAYNAYPGSVTSPANHIYFKTEIQPYGLVIKAYSNDAYILSKSHDWFEWGYFMFADIQAKPYAYSQITPLAVANPSGNVYSNNFEKHEAGGWLAYSGNTYLGGSMQHDVIFSNNLLEKEANLNEPFFYQDAKRSYFIRPFDANAAAQIKSPKSYAPPVINIIIDGYTKPPQQSLTAHYIATAPALNRSRNAYTRLSNKHAAVKNKTLSIAKAGLTAGSSSDPDTQYSIANNALGGVGASSAVLSSNKVVVTGFEFHTFHHPYSSQFVTNLNLNGLKGMLESNITIDSDKGSNFETIYKPNFTNNLVKKVTDPAYSTSTAYTYYQENVCFDAFGANSIYNWELFFHAPLYIATRLSKNGKYEEAMQWFHYIFDPTTDAVPLPNQSETSRYWKVLPFKYTPAENLETWFKSLSDKTIDHTNDDTVIAAWRNNPFKPHLIARNRPLAYMKNVVMKYVENLLNWGDSLFRMDTMESVNEAAQIYVIANHILGPRPQYVPRRGDVKPQTYNSLKVNWDGFGNALVELENLFPYTSSVPVGDTSTGNSLLGVGSALYFCIPGNDQLLGYWDTATDRLFKIRHCMNIDGVERKLALFAPPIDPGMLINAAAQGLSLGDILNDLNGPMPIYRFTYMLQRANDFCNEVKSLGGSLLSALEKKDSEELGRLRASHETQMNELMLAVKQRQVLEAKSNRDSLLKSRETAIFRLSHYQEMLGITGTSVPGITDIDADLNADSALPADTSIATVVSGLETALVPIDESGVKIIPKEKEDLERSKDALLFQQIASGMEQISGLLHFVPDFSGELDPFGVGATTRFGGSHLGSALSSLAKVPQMMGAASSFQAGQASKMASFIRREQDWALQANLAVKEIIQLDKQITTASIRLQIAQKELENLLQQIENVKEVEDYLKNKFTGLELYQWMKEQLFAVYKQSYNMAYDMAKKAESCFRYETGNNITSFIQYGYWDNMQQGLCSGEKLHLALRQLEKSYVEENRRELELTKNISVITLNPLAIQELRTAGKCNVAIPEELFDMDYQGHYFRRVKSVSLSIPCVAGPYTTINCTLRLLKNSIRVNTKLNSNGGYEHENEDGIWIDDDRFRSNNVPVKAIATSTAQHDSGMFELNFRDDRYLPFEGAGAISEWQIELTADRSLRQFDYTTLSDVIIHLNYTAREDAGVFKTNTVKHLKDYLTSQPLARMFSMKRDFSSAWYKFLHPAGVNQEQQLTITLQPDNFPYFTNGRLLKISKLYTLVQSTQKGGYMVKPGWVDITTGKTVECDEVKADENPVYGGIQVADIPGSKATANDLGNIDVFAPLSFEIKQSGKSDYKSLKTNPDELADVFMVMFYSLI